MQSTDTAREDAAEHVPSHQASSIESAPRPERAPGAPLFGNTFQFLSDTSGLIAQSYQRFGPVFRLRALWLKYTVIGGFEARDFLTSGEAEKHLSRRKIFDAVGEQLGSADFVLGQSGDLHLRFRRILSLVYSREVASPFVPDFIAAVRERIKSWRPGETRAVMPEVTHLSFEEYCRVMCGGSLRQHYRDCLMVTDYNMNIGGRVWPFFLYKMPWYQSARRRVLELMWGMVRERREKGPPPDRPATLLDTLLRVTDRAGQRLSDDEVVCYSMYGFAGSASYMSRLVGFMLYEILKHPELMKTLVAEVDSAFAQGLKNASDVRQMIQLRAVYHETLRFHPVSQGMPFHADEDFVFAGKKICKGDITVLSQVPMSFSECPFHKPQEFDHTRCLEPRNEHKTTAFHPFGIGHRTCTAMGLVELMSLTMVATLLHELDFDLSPSDYRLKLKVKPLPAPDNNFRIRLRGSRPTEARAAAKHQYTEEYIVAAFPGAEDTELQGAIAAAEIKIFEPGQTIITEGAEADAFYIIASGSVDVFKRMDEGEVHVARLGRGQYFGETGLLQNIPRTATVRAVSEAPVAVMMLAREAFLDVVETLDLESDEIGRLMRKRISTNQVIEAVRRLSAEELVQLLPGFEIQTITPGTIIIREGEAADAFYILDVGEVTLTSTKDGTEQLTGVLTPGGYFGELGLLTGQPSAATAKASGSTDSVVLRTGKAGFAELISEVADPRTDLAAALMERLKGTGGARSGAG
jgi:cytochrome P450/CRP-like cAMP-binding protein